MLDILSNMFKRAKFNFLILGAEYHTNNNHFGQSYSRAKVGEKYKENANFTPQSHLHCDKSCTC